jgi:error-prone DNA polymerase
VDDMREEFALIGLSVDKDPIAMVRPALHARGFRSACEALASRKDQLIRVAGIISHRQRPGTASGMIFMTLEDETGMLNLVVRPHLFERQRRIILGHNLLEVTARTQRDGDAFSLLCFSFAPLRSAPHVQTTSRDFR